MLSLFRNSFLLLLIINKPLAAAITTDGSLGPQLTLPGPHYLIKSQLGQQHGPNLFHSFQEFNLGIDEIATFSGPDHIHNLITRITGGHPSNIQGTLRSTLPYADFYLLNPAGILFGPTAQLDMAGSFYASTADYLRLGDQGRFNASTPQDSLLTVEPVTAFGFLTNSPSPLSIFGSQLTLNSQQHLGLFAGPLTLQHAQLQIPQGNIRLLSVAHSGEFNPINETPLDLSTGQITLDHSRLEVSGPGGGALFIQGGALNLRNSYLYAQTTGDQAGQQIKLEAHTLLLEGTELNTETQGAGKGADIFLQAAHALNIGEHNEQGVPSKIIANSRGNSDEMGNAGNITIEAGDIFINDDALISTATHSTGQGGHLVLKAMGTVQLISDGKKPLTELNASTTSLHEYAGNGGSLVIEAREIILRDGAILDITARGRGSSGQLRLQAQERISLTGNGGSASNAPKIKAYAEMNSTGGHAGDVYLQSKDIELADGAYINASTFGPGDAGTITLEATGKVTLIGAKSEGWGTWIGTGSHARLDGVKTGKGGQIVLTANELKIQHGASIGSSSVADKGKFSSEAGNILIQVEGTVTLSGVNPYGETEDGFGSGLYVHSRGVEDSAGRGGSLRLEADRLILEQGAVISSSTSGNAQGGDIEIISREFILITGDSSHLLLESPGEIQLDYRESFDKQEPDYSISGIYAKSSASHSQAGEAGRISITTPNLTLNQHGVINTSTENSGGGDITLHVSGLLDLREGKITTSVHGGNSAGGNISIQKSLFTVLDNFSLVAQADEGQGGNIHIIANNLLKTPNSFLSASSRLGIDGLIMIESPEENFSSALLTLSTGFIDVSRRLLPPCDANNPIDSPYRSHFTVNRITGSSRSPYDLIPSTYGGTDLLNSTNSN